MDIALKKNYLCNSPPPWDLYVTNTYAYNKQKFITAVFVFPLQISSSPRWYDNNYFPAKEPRKLWTSKYIKIKSIRRKNLKENYKLLKLWFDLFV